MRSGWIGQGAAGLMRSGNRCVDGERREGLRASGGQLEDGRSGELEENTWPGRSEQWLETETESNAGDRG